MRSIKKKKKNKIEKKKLIGKKGSTYLKKKSKCPYSN